jgi:hypothetical protein
LYLVFGVKKYNLKGGIQEQEIYSYVRKVRLFSVVAAKNYGRKMLIL